MSLNTLGRYQIIREIGRSNDVVYEAVDAGINRRVALKELLLPPNLSGAQKRERIERFFREARAAGSLSHPNIVTIYEVGEDHGRHFIAMEYLEGQTLRNILDIEGTLSIDRAAHIAAQVCDALEYAHSKGVIHRDIKPDNIQILHDGRIKITDFGIARIMDEPSITVDGQVFGTPSYMSPEQVAGKTLDPRSDLFSLGVVLYEMLIGRKPFTGDSVVTITYNIMNQDISIPPGIPAHFERVLRRSLAKDPGHRYSSAAELAADLHPDVYRNAPLMPPVNPYNMTMSAPGPLVNQTAGYSQPGIPQPPLPQVPPNLSAQPVPGDITPALPAIRRIISPEAANFVKVLIVVILISIILVGFVWAINAGYRGYQERLRIEEINSHMQTATQYFDQQSYNASIEEYAKALNKTSDPEVARVARRNIAVAYTRLAEQSSRQGAINQAVNYYRQSVSVDPNFADGYLLMGIALRQIGDDQGALNAWEKAAQVGYGTQSAVKAREYTAVYYHERGDAAYQHGNRDLAIDWWRKAIETAPGTNAGLLAQQKIDQALK